jgi:hypothetical protein
MLRTVESFPSFRRFMTSFRTRPLGLATEADFGALGRLPRQDLAHIKPHLLAASAPFAWHAVLYVSRITPSKIRGLRRFAPSPGLLTGCKNTFPHIIHCNC